MVRGTGAGLEEDSAFELGLAVSKSLIVERVGMGAGWSARREAA